MKVFKYHNYDHYVKAQTEGNKRKIDNVYVDSKVVNAIAKLKGEANTILCHGTRNGAEQKMFLECYPDAEVLGTEISDTADSMAPEETIITWRNQLSENGRLYIDYTYQANHTVSDATDPLQVDREEMVAFLEGLGLEVINLKAMTQRKSKDSVIYEAKKK